MNSLIANLENEKVYHCERVNIGIPNLLRGKQIKEYFQNHPPTKVELDGQKLKTDTMVIRTRY